MASPYPPFIFQDAVPAQQMMAHAQAVNEGMRIAELGKARQAEGLFRIAQLQSQQRQQEETNSLNRMIAQSQIEQNRIANEFRDKELLQRGELTREGYRTQEKIYGQGGLMNPSARTEMLKQEYNDRLAKEAKESELREVTEAERALSDIDRLEQQYRSVQSSGSKNVNTPVLQTKLGEVLMRKKEIIDGMKRKGYDWDFVNKRFLGVERPLASRPIMSSALASTPAPSFAALPAPSTPPSASSLAQQPAAMSPFAMQVQGLQPGATINQGGQSFSATPAFASNQFTAPPSASALTGDSLLDEYRSRYPGVDFVRDGDQIRVGGYQWDASMRRIAEDPNLSPDVKETAIASYLRRKYPDLFQSGGDIFQRAGGVVGRGLGSLIGR